MTLNDIKTGDTVFIDANIFIYHFTGISKECKEFLKRCEEKDLFGITGLTIMAEVCHHLMIAEAIKRNLISPNKPALQLQKNHGIIKNLSEYIAQIMNITEWGIKIISPTEDMIMKSQIFRSQFGLLTNDSFIPVYMKMSSTNKLITNDQAFIRISSINLYIPSDID